MPAPRVLFVSKEYPPESGWGGIAAWVRANALALAGVGCDVHVLSCIPGQRRTTTADGPVRVHRFGQPRLPEKLGPLNGPLTSSRAAGALAVRFALRELRLTARRRRGAGVARGEPAART